MADATFRDSENIHRLIEGDISRVHVSGFAKIVGKFDGLTSALGCTVLPNGKLIAVGRIDGSIEVRRSDTLEQISIFERPEKLPTTCISGYEQAESRQLLLASYASGETVLWNCREDGELWSIVEEGRQSLVNDFNCDFSRFVVGGSDAKISVYDLESQKLVQMLQGSMDPDVMDGHTMRVFAARFHPSRKFELVSGGWDDTVQFWDIREPFSKRKIRGPHVCGDGIAILGDKIITASWTKTNPLQIWDYESGKLIQNVSPDDLTCFLYCCRHVEAESILLAGGSDENMLRIIDINTLKSLVTFRNLPGAVYFARELPSINPYGLTKTICFCSSSSTYVAEIEI